jgi:hypothetical protein
MIDREFGDALKETFRCIGGEVGDQFVVNGQVGGENEKFFDAVGEVEIADEGSHQAGFTDSGGEGKTEGGEFAIEVGNGGKFAVNGG